MKPHPRIRKTIKWGGAAVAALLVVVWIWSGWYGLNWTGRGGRWISVRAGRLHWCDANPSAVGRVGWVYYQTGGGDSLEWRLGWERTNWGCHVVVPLWLVGGMVIPITISAWRLEAIARRRARLNLCPKCDYDRAGIARDAKCPECGAMPKVG